MQPTNETTARYVTVAPKYRVARTTFLVVCCALLVALVCMLFNVYRLQTQVVALQGEVARAHLAALTEMGQVRQLSSRMVKANRSTMQSIREELEEAKQAAQASAGEARMEALSNVQRLGRELKSEERRQLEMHDSVKTQLAAARQVVATADARLADVQKQVGSVRTEVGSMKTEVAKTQNNVQQAVHDLRRVIGDMGVMSGLVATNERELEVLKAVGDRTYTEFRIVKSKQPQSVNGIAILLKRADQSSRRYTLEVINDDQRVQKRDKTVNEPVQFYVARKKQPYEIVVNQIGKDEIAGYLATPKLDLDRD